MTREELKAHCKKQVEMCEMWAKAKGEQPCGRIYEEHKLILELLEQEPKTGRWIKSQDSYGNYHFTCPFCEHDIATKADVWEDNYCSNCGAKMQGVEE